MMLCGEHIAEHLEKGARTDDPLIISPCPDLTLLKDSGAASVDLRLGSWFAAPRRATMGVLDCRTNLQETQISKSSYVPIGQDYYLHPRTFVLGVTLEWIRLPRDFVGTVTGRSSWGRRGLVIATATAVHPGFTGCLTLELANIGELPISIQPGTRICQLSLMYTEARRGDARDRTQFLGQRKPCIGTIEEDALERRMRSDATPR
jgi:dCTP deaminase